MKEKSSIVFKTEGVRCIVNKACGKRHTFNNYYGLDLTDVAYYGDEENLFIIKPFEGYARLYIMANDMDTVKLVLKSLPPNHCINIPSKKGIGEWGSLLDESGFSQIAIYKRYGYINYRKGNEKNLMFAGLEDLPLIDEELHHFFSSLTGHLPNAEDLAKMIEEKQIVVNRDADSRVTGALCYQIKGKKAELPFWFDRAGTGLSLLYNVFFLCHQADIRQIVFWVNDTNKSTIAIHSLLGAKPDGLVDYIFNKE